MILRIYYRSLSESCLSIDLINHFFTSQEYCINRRSFYTLIKVLSYWLAVLILVRCFSELSKQKISFRFQKQKWPEAVRTSLQGHRSARLKAKCLRRLCRRRLHHQIFEIQLVGPQQVPRRTFTWSFRTHRQAQLWRKALGLSRAHLLCGFRVLNCIWLKLRPCWVIYLFEGK